MPEMPSEHRVNPEWEALEGKPHLAPLNCVPDQYKSIRVGKPPTNFAECQRCGTEIEYTPVEDVDTECSYCRAKYIVNIDAEFVDGRWKDLTKLRRL